MPGTHLSPPFPRAASSHPQGGHPLRMAGPPCWGAPSPFLTSPPATGGDDGDCGNTCDGFGSAIAGGDGTCDGFGNASGDGAGGGDGNGGGRSGVGGSGPPRTPPSASVLLRQFLAAIAAPTGGGGVSLAAATLGARPELALLRRSSLAASWLAPVSPLTPAPAAAARGGAIDASVADSTAGVEAAAAVPLTAAMLSAAVVHTRRMYFACVLSPGSSSIPSAGEPETPAPPPLLPVPMLPAPSTAAADVVPLPVSLPRSPLPHPRRAGAAPFAGREAAAAPTGHGPQIVNLNEMLIPVAADAAAGLMCCLAIRDPGSHASRGHTPGTFAPTVLRVVVDTATRETLWVGPSADGRTVVVEWMVDAGRGSGRDVTVSEFWVVRAQAPGGDVTVFEPATAYGAYVRDAPAAGESVGALTRSPPSLTAVVAHRGGVFGASTAVPTGELVAAAATPHGAAEGGGQWPPPPMPRTPIVSMMVVADWGSPADRRRLSIAAAAAAAGNLAAASGTGGPLARRPVSLLLPPLHDERADDGAGCQGRHVRRRRRRVDLSAVPDEAARERILRNREAAARANERRARAKQSGLSNKRRGGRGGAFGGGTVPGRPPRVGRRTPAATIP